MRLRKRAFSVLVVTSLLAGNLIFAPLKAHADTSWADIISPLVNQVLIPGAVKLMSKHSNTSTGSQVQSVQTVGEPEVITIPPTPDSSASSDAPAPTPDGPAS